MGAAGTVAALAGRPASRWYSLLLAAGRDARARPARMAGRRLAAQLRGRRRDLPARAGALMRAARALPRAARRAAPMTIAATLGDGAADVVPLRPGLARRAWRRTSLALPAIAPVMWIGMLARRWRSSRPCPAELLNASTPTCSASCRASPTGRAACPARSGSSGSARPPALVAAYALIGGHDDDRRPRRRGAAAGGARR